LSHIKPGTIAEIVKALTWEEDIIVEDMPESGKDWILFKDKVLN
jgi:hypothetical protein